MAATPWLSVLTVCRNAAPLLPGMLASQWSCAFHATYDPQTAWAAQGQRSDVVRLATPAVLDAAPVEQMQHMAGCVACVGCGQYALWALRERVSSCLRQQSA